MYLISGSLALHTSIITLRFKNASLSFILLRKSLNLFNQQFIAQISFAILVTYLRTISTHTETATAKYPPTYYVLAEVVAVATAAAGVLAIGEKVGAIVK